MDGMTLVGRGFRSGVVVGRGVVAGTGVVGGTGVIVGRTNAGSKGFMHPARRDTAKQRQRRGRIIFMF
jgi:hypothetical protein